MIHKKSASVSDLRSTERKLDKIIKDCIKTKREIHANFDRISQQMSSQRNGWRKIENYIKDNKYKEDGGLIGTQDLKEKFRVMCEKQNDKRIRKLSKFLYFNKDEQISQNELGDQNTVKFFSNNKREFGSSLKGVFLHKPRKTESCDISITPSELNLASFFQPRSNLPIKHGYKPANPPEIPLTHISHKDEIILKELKKIESKSTFMRRRNLLSSKKPAQSYKIYSQE